MLPALTAVSRTRPGRDAKSTTAPSNSGPNNGIYCDAETNAAAAAASTAENIISSETPHHLLHHSMLT